MGSFFVRDSESRPDTLALSIRVPNHCVLHYLILSDDNGWRIKVEQQVVFKNKSIFGFNPVLIVSTQGSTKRFSSLSSLIVHHSVMSELLPCSLLIVPHLETEEDDLDGKDGQDFADLELLEYPDLLFTLRKALGSTSDLDLEPGASPSPTALSEISSSTHSAS